MIIRPAKTVNGRITLPGDKSISHRAAMFAAMADGESLVHNFAGSEDCRSTLNCLRQLGIDIDQEGRSVRVGGKGKTGFRKSTEPLDCGNSGTSIRLLAGILAGQGFDSVLTGDASLRRRPMRRIIEPLRLMGAEIRSEDDRPPLHIGAVEGLTGIDFRMPIASAQLKSCLLLAGLNALDDTVIREPVQTRDHTERMLRGFGVDVQITVALEGGKILSVSRDGRFAPKTFRVPSDISAAAFFLTAAACLEGSSLEMPGVGLNPTRIAVIELLRSAGVEIVVGDETSDLGEPSGTLRVSGNPSGLTREPIKIDGDTIADLIDEIPILAVLGTQLEGGLEVRDAGELRVKETDRIAAVVANLALMGADVEEFDDGFRVGKSQLEGATLDSYDDHRIAMAFAVAGLLAEGDTEIDGSECVAISFPNFFEELQNVVVCK